MPPKVTRPPGKKKKEKLSSFGPSLKPQPPSNKKNDKDNTDAIIKAKNKKINKYI